MSTENNIPAVIETLSAVRDNRETIVFPRTVTDAVTCKDGTMLDKRLDELSKASGPNVLRASGNTEVGNAPAIDADRLDGLTSKDFMKGVSEHFNTGETILFWANNNDGVFNKFATTDYGIPEDAPVQLEGFVELFIDNSIVRKEVRYSVYGGKEVYKRTIYGTDWDSDWVNIASGGCTGEVSGGIIYVPEEIFEEDVIEDELLPEQTVGGLSLHDCCEAVRDILVHEYCSDENLVINSNMKDPINTSGNSSWVGDDIICINKWYIDSNVSNGSRIELINDGLNISVNNQVSDVQYAGIYQHINKLDDGVDYMVSLSINNTIYTISVVGNNALSGGVDIIENVRFYYIINHPDTTKDTIFIRLLNNTDTLNITINWVKLEYGKFATPFIPPNKDVERLKCGDYSVVDAKTFNGLLKNKFMGNDTDFEYAVHNYEDLNTIKYEHHAFVFNMENSPEGFEYGFLDVSYYCGEGFTPTEGKAVIRQVLTCWKTGHVWVRIYDAHADIWTNWRKISVEPENFVKQYTDKEVPLEVVNDPTYNDNYEGCINGTVAMSIGLPDSWWNIKYMKFMNYGDYGIQIAFPISYDMNIKYRRALGTDWLGWMELPLLINNSLVREQLGFALGYGEVRADGNHIRLKAFNTPFDDNNTVSLMVLNSNFAPKQDTLQLWRTENGELIARNVLHEDNYSDYVQPIHHNAGCHNTMYRGIDLTNVYSIEEICNRISSGTFKDLYIGDYFDIIISTEYNQSEIVRCILAGFDSLYMTGDRDGFNHHAVIVPKNSFSTTHRMNQTSTTSGAYYNSYIHQTVLPKYADALYQVFGSHMYVYRDILTTEIEPNVSPNGYGGWTGASGAWGWYDVKLRLLNECAVFGNSVFSSSAFDTGILNKQLPLFALNPRHAMAGIGGTGDGRAWYWLSSVASSDRFCYASAYGCPDCSSAMGEAGIRPMFLIG